MRFSREDSAFLMVRSVSDAGIRIGRETYTTTIALTVESVTDDWPQKPVAELVEADFARLLADRPDVIILGTGAANIFPPRDLVFAMARYGVGLEAMDTKAAARTFNVLAGDERSVAAVLYPVRS